MRMMLCDVAVARGRATILHDVSTAFEPGSISVLAGPNGAGKSSLMSCMAGDLAPAAGTISIGDRPLSTLSVGALARCRAMLRQQSDIAFGFRVRDVVAMGLSPHALPPAAGDGARLVAHAMEALDLTPMADRPATDLSGGETQRVHLARVLVQARAALLEARGVLLLLDEPTTGLDYRHQLALGRLVKDMARAGATVVCSLHDLHFACRLADRLLLLAKGRLVASVMPDRLDAALLAELYAIGMSDAAALLPAGGAPARAGRRPH